MTTRTCSSCFVEKELNEVNFSPNDMYVGGFTRQCRTCRNLKIREWQKRNPESLAKASAKYIRTDKGKEMSARHRDKYREERNAYAKEWHAANPHKDRNYALKQRYGITLEDYNRMFAEQNGVCAICHKPETTPTGKGKNPDKIKVLAVDHCHRTNGVRKLLCYMCNQMLGGARDSVEILQAAIDYLKQHDVQSSITT